MASRRIGILTSSVGGKVNSLGEEQLIRTESSLETDFALLMDFDPSVAFIQSQPVTIPYLDEHGKQRTYTPDFLVHYMNGEGHSPNRCPQLVEIKYASELKERSDEFAFRFKVARKYAEWRKWSFEVVTDQEIRTDYLINAKFLGGFIRRPRWDQIKSERIFSHLSDIRKSTAQDIIQSLEDDPHKQLQLLPHLWQLVAYRYVDIDLGMRVTMTTPISYKERRSYLLKRSWSHV